MIRFRNLYFPKEEKTLPEHMAASGNVFLAGAGTYQLHKLLKALPYVRDFGVAVDVGANVGTWTRVLARLFAQVHAFEPIPAFRECLEMNIIPADLEHVKIHECALGCQSGEVEMSVNPSSSGWTHVRSSSEKSGNSFVNVPIRSLDGFDIGKVHLIKIDVEGFELNVVRGAEKTIIRHRPVVIVEQKPGTPSRYGLPQKGAVKLLESWGASVAFEWSGDYCLYWKN